MVYTYTTYALTSPNQIFLIMALIVALFCFIAVSLTSENLKYGAIVAALVFVSFSYFSWRDPYPNEKVTATMVDIGESTYKSGKHSYVKGATVTYKLPDGGLVTFRADGGSAWYPEITLYKNPQR